MKYNAQNIIAIAVIVTLGVVGYRTLDQSNVPIGPLYTKVSSTTPSNMVTTSSLPSETGSSVDAFIDSQGVNVHSPYLSTPYAIAPAVTNALGALHIHNVRDNVSVSPSATEVNDIAAWIGAGVKFNYTVGGSVDTNRIAQLLSEITGHSQAASTIGIEGTNEWDSNSTACGDATTNNWVSDDRAMQSALYPAVRGVGSLGGAKVVGPSLIGIRDGSKGTCWNDAALLGDLTGSLDLGNVHAYPGAGSTPENTIGGHQAAEAHVSGSKPIWATESGYNDCPTGTCTSSPGYVTQADQGTLDPRIFLADYLHGVAKTFIYELFDEAAGGSNFQDYWGLANYTASSSVSLKPSGQSIANMNSILIGGSDQGGASSSSLSYSVAGDGQTQHLLLTRRSSGTDHYVVAVWENSLPDSQSTGVTLSFAQGMNVTKYTPVSTPNAVSSTTGTTSYHDTIGPAVTIYDITVTPAAAPACPSGQTGTPPNCVTPTAGSTSGGTSSGSGSSTGASGTTKTVTAASLGSANAPIKASSVTLSPQTSLPLKDIIKVEYLIDGKLVATVTKAPFTYTLTKAQVKNGCHSVSTIVYATVGPTTKTNRQVCVALTGSTMSAPLTWSIGLGSLLAAALLALEFAPFYPKRSHLVSRTVVHLWRKIRPNTTPPTDPSSPPDPRRPEGPFVPVPGQTIQPGHHV